MIQNPAARRIRRVHHCILDKFGCGFDGDKLSPGEYLLRHHLTMDLTLEDEAAKIIQPVEIGNDVALFDSSKTKTIKVTLPLRHHPTMDLTLEDEAAKIIQPVEIGNGVAPFDSSKTKTIKVTLPPSTTKDLGIILEDDDNYGVPYPADIQGRLTSAPTHPTPLHLLQASHCLDQFY